MATLIWCACLLLLADFTRGAHDIDVDRLANQQSDLVRETFNVIEAAIEAQYEMFDVRIKGLEARIEELERVISEGNFVPNQPAVPVNPKPVKPKPIHPEPEPEPEPEPTPTTRAPTTTRTTTVRTTTTTQAPVALAPPQTCQEIYDRGEMASGIYSIDPKGSGRPFNVQCNMVDGAVQTVVGHDSESEQRNNGNKAAGSYELIPTYNADMDQMAALADVSTSCQQFIKLRCKSAVLFAKKGVDYGWWVSRSGDTMRSWGGVEASMSSRKCACSETNDCPSGKLCHCDAAGKIESTDEGLLKDKEYLPVKAVYLGDTGGRKQGSYLTLGSFVCTDAE